MPLLASASAPPREFLGRVQSSLLPGRTVASLRALRARGIVERAGQTVGTFETLALRSPRALRETTVLDGVREVVTLVDDEGWVEDSNGAVRSVSGDEIASLHLAHALLFHDWLDGELEGFTIEADSLESAHPRLTFSSIRPGPARSLVFATDEGALRVDRFESKEQGVDVVTAFSDWRSVEGLRFPFVARQSTGDPRFDVVTRTESLTMPTSLPRAIEPPERPSVSDVVWRDRALARAVPLHSVGALWALDVAVDGRTFGTFLLDTGAGATVIASETARTLGLPSRGVVEARGAGGSEAAAYVDVETLALPGVEIRGQTLVSLPLASLSQALGTPIQGILGWDFLNRLLVEIDREHARVGLYERDTYTPPSGAARIELRLEANVPRIEGVVEGHAGSFLLDTGNATALLLHTDFAEKHGFLERAEASSFAMAGIGGSAAVREVTVSTLRFGPLEFENVRAVLAPFGTGVVALQESVGNVGASLFAGRVLALDYGGGALWVGPPGGSAAATADSASAR